MSNFKKIKIVLLAYIYLTAIFSTFSFCYAYLQKNFYNIVPLGTSAQLEGGFVYNSRLNGKDFWGITDKTGNPIVSQVTALKTHGNVIYGQRDLGIAGHEYTYFICIYGDDCSHTQNYGDVVFNKELEKMGLPAFDPFQADTQKGLLLKAWLKTIVTCPWCLEDIIGT
jgi:hypothetical protein